MTPIRRRSQKGFTLMEMLIVVAIIAVLIAIAIPVYNNNTEKAREAYDVHTMRQAASAAMELYYAGIHDQQSAIEAGLSWWGSAGNANANAWGAYDPATGKFYNTKNKVSAYGKGTKTNAGTTFVMGNDRGAYGADLDYTNGIIMIAIYPYGNPHVDIYWKYKNPDSYIGGQHAASDPKYSIRVPLN